MKNERIISFEVDEERNCDECGVFDKILYPQNPNKPFTYLICKQCHENQSRLSQ
jgi:hypothetical protein